MLPPLILLSFLSISAFISISTSLSVNHTIDDEFGDELTGQHPDYEPQASDVWRTGTECADCQFQLDTSRLYRGTWKAVTHFPGPATIPSMSVQFSGTAVYVFNAIAGLSDGSQFSSVTYITFEIDGVLVGDFLRDTFDGIIEYRVPVYVNEGLANGPHTLVMRVPAGRDGESTSRAHFDYIVYTTPQADFTSNTTTRADPQGSQSSVSTTSNVSSGTLKGTSSPASSHSSSNSSLPTNPSTTSHPWTSSLSPSPTSSDPSTITVASSSESSATPIGAIVGGAVGGAALLALSALFAVYLMRRPRSPTAIDAGTQGTRIRPPSSFATPPPPPMRSAAPAPELRSERRQDAISPYADSASSEDGSDTPTTLPPQYTSQSAPSDAGTAQQHFAATSTPLAEKLRPRTSEEERAERSVRTPIVDAPPEYV